MPIVNEMDAYMKRRLSIFSESLKNGRNSGELANLRRGLSRKPGELPELWGIIFSDMPESLMSKTGEPTYAEWSIYIALTCYALHQQGNGDSVHAEGMSFGKAVANIAEGKDDVERVLRRFNALATSDGIEELAFFMRTMIQLLKSNDIKLDYIKLANDLFFYQISEEERNKIRLRWAQDFYIEINKMNSNEED